MLRRIGKLLEYYSKNSKAKYIILKHNIVFKAPSTDSNSQTKAKESLHGAEWTRENFLKKWDLKNRENLGKYQAGGIALSQKGKLIKKWK